MIDDLFDRARDAVSCRDVAERRVVLRKKGTAWRGECPLSGCGANSKGDPFVVLDDGRRWKCWSCDPRGGDVCDLEHKLFSSGSDSLADAARRLVGGEVRQESEASRARRALERARAEAEAMKSAAWKAELSARLWREAVPAIGTPVETYLKARGIFGPVAARALALLRFHPRAYHSGHPELGVFLPAMVALITTEFGATGGVHVTYLAPDGRGKTHRSPAKRMWGPQGVVTGVGEAAVAVPGGIWLTRPDAPGLLVVAEGIENALSAAIIVAGELSLPVRAAAAGSLDRLQGQEFVDAEGARDVWKPQGDPARPPFTWPEDPAAPWGRVAIAVDPDMSPVAVMGRSGRGRLTPFQRDAKARAFVSATLAASAWKGRLAIGSTTTVGAIQPPAGIDFNDHLRAVQTARSEETRGRKADAFRSATGGNEAAA